MEIDFSMTFERLEERRDFSGERGVESVGWVFVVLRIDFLRMVIFCMARVYFNWYESLRKKKNKIFFLIFPSSL